MAQTQAPETPAMNIASLYVGDLRSTVTEQTLWNAFSPYGQVLSVKICRNSQNQVSLGYGYVNYRTQAEAEKAMRSVNFTNIDGRACRVMWSQRDPTRRKCGVGNLFIKNIDPVLDTKSLYEAFSAFGPILSCKIACDEYGLSKGYGFIQFANQADADEARRKSDGVPFMKKKIVVTNFIPKSARLDAKPVNPDDYTNVFVRNLSPDFTTEQLKALFSKFGQITSCVVQRDEKTNSSLEFGFINFSSAEGAQKAVNEMNGFEISNNQKIFVCRAMKKLERVAFLRKQHEEKKREFFKRYEKHNLYVKNFDESITDEKLKDMFSQYGQILSAHVMLDENNKSRGFGFVCFDKPDEAKVALDEMNSKVFDNKPLYVSYAQNKEDRRKMMENRTYENTLRAPLFTPATLPFVYPHPGPYPGPQYARYQAPIRHQPRGMNPNMQMQGYPSGPVKGGYGFQQAMNPPHHPPHYRARSNVGGNHPQTGPRHSQNMSQKMQNSHQGQMQAAVNIVGSEPASKSSKENAKSTKAVHPDKMIAFKDRAFKLTQRVFQEKSYDIELVKHIAGMIIEYFTNSDISSLDDQEIIDAIENAHSQFLNKEQ